ncbi:hypothetical protein BS47DRAFT_1365380 [Hydnum rufescens UP504]|uniref:Uncharacterized protein n=1 Tax=Hydnum rufescens UP504 TaxID=1448309 RepID=A0A9P6APG2_9AGAM|nr:hypothetical protein BS47DRAFT_1365380 [Hydnum rufescens UP504]
MWAICCTSEAIHSAQNLGTEVKAPMDSPAPKESPFPLPQPTFLQNGWLAYVPGMSADDPRTAVVSFYEGPPSLSALRIEVVFIPSWAQTPLLPAVEGTARFWQEPYPEDGFPKGARRYYHFFVCPTPPPILSPLPLHVEPRTVEGWMVDRDGFVSIEPMRPNEITPEVERQTGWDSIPLKLIQVSYWRDEDRWAIADPMPSLPNTVRATGGQYPPGAEAYVALALPGTPPIDRGAGTLLPLALAGARLIGRKTRSICPTGRHTGRIELPGPDPTRDCPQVGIEIVEEALPAVGKAVGTLEMKVKMGVQIPGPQNDNDRTPPSSKQELSSHTRDAGARLLERNRGDAAGQYHPKWANNNPSCFKDFKEEVPLLNPNGWAPNSALLQKLLQNPKSSVQRLVEQLPCRITAVNSGGLPIPEFYQLNLSPYTQLDYSLSLSVPVQFQQARAHLPFVLRPRYRSQMVPYPNQTVDLIPSQAHNPVYTNASPEYLERIMGPRSPLEASYLKGFQYLKRLDALGAIAQSPFKDKMNVLETYKMLRPTLQRGHLKFEEWCSEVDGLEGKTYLSLALVRLATHMALDTIAYLGSLESPVFSPDETLMGAIFGPSLEPQAPEPGTPDNSMQWNAVLMERLGVPCWGIMPSVGPQQLDFDAGGQPDVDPLKEADFQKGMRVISQDQQPLQVVVYSQKCLCSPPSSPPVGPREFSDNLKAVIIRALDTRDLAEQYHPQGVLAFKGSLVLVKEWGIRQKDSQKVLEINLLFKRPNQQDAVLQRLRESDPKVDARTVDTDPHNWRSDYQHFFDEGYIRQLFADPRPIKDIEALLELAPPSSHPINTREAAKTVAMDMERARQALLLQMFEAGRYPPLRAFEAKSVLCGKASEVELGRSFNQGTHDESVGAEFVQYAPKDR